MQKTCCLKAAWLVGDRFSIAGSCLLVSYRWGALIGLDMAHYGAWTGHKNCMIVRPAVEQVLVREGLEFF